MQFLRQSTASQEVFLGPFVSDTDFKTAQTGLTIANTDIKIWKNGAITEVNKNSGGATHVASGRYYAVLDATDTDTVGMLELNISVSGALPVKSKYYVLTQSVYDSLFATSSTGPLKPTVDGRTLDITATGAAGIDWGNVENQGAMVALANTGIQDCYSVDFVNSLNAGAITASSIAASALDNKGNWNVGKSGYALTPTTGLGNQTANITGSIQSVTNRVTANTDQWNGVAVTGMPMPTFTLPANFSSLAIVAGGYVVVSGDSFGNTLIIPNLASQSSVNNLATSVAALPTATQNRDAVVNANPDDPYNSSSWIKRVIIGLTAQREVAVTGAHHVAADMHEIQPGVITFNAFDTDAINLNAIDGAVYTAIATAVASTQALSRLDSMIESDGAGQFRFDTIALSMGAGGGGGAVNIVVEDRSITVE